MKGSQAAFGAVISRAIKLIWREGPVLALFTICYQFVLLVLLPMTRDGVIYAAGLAGAGRISGDTIQMVLRSPAAVVFLLFMLLLYLFLITMEVAGVLCCFDCAARGERIGLARLFTRAFWRAVGVFRPGRAAVLLLIAVVLPVTGAAAASGVTPLQLPEFIKDTIYESPMLLAGYAVLLGFLYLVLFRYLFVVNRVLVDGLSAREAGRQSRKLMRGRWRQTAAKWLLWFLIEAAVMALAAGAALAVLVGRTCLLEPGVREVYYWSAFVNLDSMGLAAAAMGGMIGNLAFLTALFDCCRGAPALPERERLTVRRGLGQAARCAVCAAMFLLYAETTAQNWVDPQLTLPTEIVAHRAGGAFGPENTVAALGNAVDAGAETAEIDVRLTRDGALAVVHDGSWKRTAGVNRQVSDMTREEMRALDAGSYFSRNYAGEPAPTLDDMLAAAKGRVQLMIEMKGDSRDGALERAVRDAIARYGMQDSCIVASLSYDKLVRFQQLQSGVRTCYIATLLMGDVDGLTGADCLSVEATNVTSELVASAHAAGKTLYGWTVNRDGSIRRLIEMRVDGVVTDNPYLAKYVIGTGGRSELAEAIWQAVGGDE